MNASTAHADGSMTGAGPSPRNPLVPDGRNRPAVSRPRQRPGVRGALRRSRHLLGLPAHAALEEHLTVVYVEPVGTAEDSRLPSHPHGYTRERYSRFLQILINRLGVPKVHLLGHSHGAFVAAHHALHRPEQLAGVVLYEGAPVTGPEHGAEAGRRVEAFAAKHAGHPGCPMCWPRSARWRHLQRRADPGGRPRCTAVVLRRLLGQRGRLAPFRDAVRATYISGLDGTSRPMSSTIVPPSRDWSRRLWSSWAGTT